MDRQIFDILGDKIDLNDMEWIEPTKKCSQSDKYIEKVVITKHQELEASTYSYEMFLWIKDHLSTSYSIKILLWSRRSPSVFNGDKKLIMLADTIEANFFRCGRALDDFGWTFGGDDKDREDHVNPRILAFSPSNNNADYRAELHLQVKNAPSDEKGVDMKINNFLKHIEEYIEYHIREPVWDSEEDQMSTSDDYL